MSQECMNYNYNYNINQLLFKYQSFINNLQLCFSELKNHSDAEVCLYEWWIDWQQDSSVHDVDYESFDSILCSNRSQKSQEISIQRNSNDVRMLHEQKSWSCRVFIYATTFFLTVTIDLREWLMTCQCQ